MTELLAQVELAKPEFLWLLLTLPILWFRFRRRRLTVIFWRSLILLLLIVALADPQSVSEQSSDEERIFAFDLSNSIPGDMRRWMAGVTENELKPGRNDRIFLFAGEVRQAMDWQEWLKGDGKEKNAPRPEKTNLENLLNAIAALPPAPRALFLFTDGWETEGNAERLLPAMAAAGVKIYPMLPAERPEIANVAVTKLLAPSHGTSGEAVNLRVVVENHNRRAVEGTLTLERNGQPVKTDAVQLKPGSQIFNYQSPLPDQPLVSYRVAFASRRADADIYKTDNEAMAWVSVKTKAKVLLINGAGGGRYLEEILKRRGFEVTARSADGAPAPAGYGLVIFNNAEREKFSAGYLAAVERHVAEGNGFLMLGSEASFAPGAYRRTPIEPLLPVEPKEPKREEKNRAVVLVIDKSGSMREENRILYAQEAAKAVVRQLKDNDFLAIVGFDVSAFVLVPLETIGRLRGSVDSQIDRLRPGGQTYFLPALLEAKRQIERANVGRRHIILLSDGETRGSQSELIDLVTVLKNEMKVTVSAIALGAEADIRIMKRISQYGGGLFHHTFDPRHLPQIVLQQLQDDAKEEAKGERNLVPVQERGSEVLEGFAARSYPGIFGYMETELKRGAHLDLFIPRDDHRAPLLASWRYGKGNAAVLTTDMEGRWSRNWIQWSLLQDFWGKVFDWLRPAEEAIPAYEARVSLATDHPVLDLYIYEEASADSQFYFTISAKERRAEGTLRKLAIGHYQAPLPVTAPGNYRIELAEQRRGRRMAYPPIGYTLPYDRLEETARPEFNSSLLLRLAEATGGTLNPGSPQSLAKQTVTKNHKPLNQPLIVCAFVLFLLEVTVRRLVFKEND